MSLVSQAIAGVKSTHCEKRHDCCRKSCQEVTPSRGPGTGDQPDQLTDLAWHSPHTQQWVRRHAPSPHLLLLHLCCLWSPQIRSVCFWLGVLRREYVRDVRLTQQPAELLFWYLCQHDSTVVAICTACGNIEKRCILPTDRVYAFCVFLTINSRSAIYLNNITGWWYTIMTDFVLCEVVTACFL